MVGFDRSTDLHVEHLNGYSMVTQYGKEGRTLVTIPFTSTGMFGFRLLSEHASVVEAREHIRYDLEPWDPSMEYVPNDEEEDVEFAKTVNNITPQQVAQAAATFDPDSPTIYDQMMEERQHERTADPR